MEINYKNYSVLEILEMIAAEPSKNIKVQIIKDASNNEEFVATLKAAYNPFVTYGVKKFEMGKPLPNYSTSQTLQHVYHTTLKSLADRTLSGNNALKRLNLLTDSLTEDRAVVLQRVINRDLRMGCNVSSINKAIKGLIPTYKVSLCSPFDKDAIMKMDFPVMCQVKEDGMRISSHVSGRGIVQSRTRNGLDYVLPEFVNDQLASIASQFGGDVVLDGEVLVEINGKLLTRSKANGVIAKCIAGSATQKERDGVRVVLWDCIPEDKFQLGVFQRSYKDRFTILRNFMSTLNTPSITASETYDCRDYEEIQEIFKRMQARGKEGLLVKNPTAPWKNKRTKDAVKMKDFKDCELKIVGYLEGKKGTKNEGKLGAFCCEDLNGFVKVNIGSGMSQEERDMWFNDDVIGKIITVQYMGVTKASKKKERSLEHATFKEMRIDKDEADNLELL